jgi:lipopolysaccharide export system protein LptA
MTLYLSDDEKAFKKIELRENAQVTPLPGKSSDLPEMRARDIDLNFHPNATTLQDATLNQDAMMVLTNESGRRSVEGAAITFATATDGKTLTRLNARDRVVVKTPKSGTTPERRISGNSLQATATPGQEQKGLTSARFEGRVEFLELMPAGNGKPEGKRQGTSQILTAALAGQLDAIERATFEQDVDFRDGDVRGNADVGVYDAQKGELQLRPLRTNPKLTPHAKTSSVTVDAKDVIVVNLNTNDVQARRDVTTVSEGQKDVRPTAKDKTAIFNSTDKLYGSGAEFDYSAGPRLAVYRGTAQTPARLRQSNNTEVNADSITFSDQDQNLTAIGRVDMSFLMAARSGDATQKPFHAVADELHYVDAKRTATYQGRPARLSSADGVTRGNRIVLELAAESRTLKQLAATTSVRMVLTEGRIAEAETLLYEAVKDVYSLQGKPVRLFKRETDGKCSIQEGQSTTFEGAIGSPQFNESANAVGGAPSNSGLQCPSDMPQLKPAAPAKK